MANTFRVGERVIYIGNDPELQGKEVIIEEPLQLCIDPDDNYWFGYPINHCGSNNKWKKPLQTAPKPHQLKRKSNDDLPQKSTEVELSSWDKVGWSPNKISTIDKA